MHDNKGTCTHTGGHEQTHTHTHRRHPKFQNGTSTFKTGTNDNDARGRTLNPKNVMLRVRRRVSQSPVRELHIKEARPGQRLVKRNNTRTVRRRVFRMVDTVKFPTGGVNMHQGVRTADGGSRRVGVKRSMNAVKRPIDPIEEAFDPPGKRDGAKLRKTIPILDCEWCTCVHLSLRVCLCFCVCALVCVCVF